MENREIFLSTAELSQFEQLTASFEVREEHLLDPSSIIYCYGS